MRRGKAEDIYATDGVTAIYKNPKQLQEDQMDRHEQVETINGSRLEKLAK